MQTFEDAEKEIQQLEQQVATLKDNLRKRRKEPLPMGARVQWEKLEQACCQVYSEGVYRGVVVNREFRDSKHHQNSRWFYSVQTEDGQVHVGVDAWDINLM